MISALIWNVRGLGQISTIRRLKKRISLYSISLLVLQEPLVSYTHAQDICHKLGFVDSFSNVNNKVWILWKQPFQLEVLVRSEQFLHCFLKHPMLSAGIFVTGIYAFSTRTGRRLLWDDLLNLQQECASRPWLVGGDFNCILSAEESAGPVFPDSGSILDFAGFLGQGDFRELPTSGGVFTWSGVRSRGRVWRKLDRLLFNSEWLV